MDWIQKAISTGTDKGINWELKPDEKKVYVYFDDSTGREVYEGLKTNNPFPLFDYIKSVVPKEILEKSNCSDQIINRWLLNRFEIQISDLVKDGKEEKKE